ncbi:MAG: 30S ribosomal protein S12 methylthiotransferase RimO [Oscillospiraceae bacterium]|nr:30S ribosomal protein S12 methylthiotransferase RimO [Oscillospiraceae bacterium]
MPTFSLTSLGCAKNLVNSEQMLYLLQEAGYTMLPEPDGADFAVINTCGFIDAAKSEAIDCILEHAALKAEGRLGGIIVTGCLPERYQEEILQELPEIDAVLGVGSFGEIVSAADTVLKKQHFRSFLSNSAPVDEIPRMVSTGPGWAYLRIAEGCDNFCAFCAIPFIRGRYRSREMEAVIREAEELAQQGVKELIVIAQDITRYGTDRYGKRCLAELCRRLSAIPGIRWIRLHYLYPDQFDDELIDEIARNDKIVKYLDIPIQHINNSILHRMNRRGTGDEIRTLFKTLRERIPGLVLRTSLITGLPGEGEAEFEELCAFLREAGIERAGVFPFSPEEGTPAEKMPHPDAETAAARADAVLAIQGEFLDAFAESLVGSCLTVLIEQFDEETGCWIGRSYADSPEIDSMVFVTGSCSPGDMPTVLVESAENGILYGRTAESEDTPC